MADDGHVGIARAPIHISYTFIDKLVPFSHDKDPIFPLFLSKTPSFFSISLYVGFRRLIHLCLGREQGRVLRFSFLHHHCESV